MATPAILQDASQAPTPLRPGRPSRTLLLELLLLTSTLLSTTVVGMRYAANFRAGAAPISSELDIFPYSWAFAHRAQLTDGLPFSLTLLAILLAHEFGHLFAARSFGVRATLPFVLPAPSLSGTAGAIIRLRTRVSSRAGLLTIGAMGPIAGFMIALPAALIGLSLSRPGHPSADRLVEFHLPLLLRLAAPFLRPEALTHDLAWHPVLVAAWIGLLITALNLVPAGQFDGGHILYAFSPRAHRWGTWCIIGLLILLGFTAWIGWLLWAGLLLLPGMRHPTVDDTTPLTPGLIALATLSLVIFILCAVARPFSSATILHALSHH